MDSRCPVENSESVTKTETTPDSDKNNEKHLNNVTLNMSKDVIAAAGFNVQEPIVNALIGNLTGTLPRKKSEVGEVIKCEVCNCDLTPRVYEFHVNGSRHRKKLKALNIIQQLKEGKEKGVQLGDSSDPNAYRCEVCSLTLNSPQQLEFHLLGAKHKRKAGKAGLAEVETTEAEDKDLAPPPAKIKKSDGPKVLVCDICNIFMNSQTQYDQHLKSKKHLNKAKPPSQQRKGIWTHKRFLFRGGHIQRPPGPPNSIFRCSPYQFNMNRPALRRAQRFPKAPYFNPNMNHNMVI